MEQRMHEAASALIEQMGMHIEQYGLPRIAGRILGFLLLDGKCHSLDELAEILGVSKASISTNARVLEANGIIERRSTPGDRRDFYRLSRCPWESMFVVARRRMTDLKDLLDSSYEQLPDEMAEARRRIDTWRDFHAFLLDDLDHRIARWRDRRAEAGQEAQG